MDNNIQKFFNRLKSTHSPSFLLLGQKYLSTPSGDDPFLSSIINKYFHEDKVDRAHINYAKIFIPPGLANEETARAWISNAANRLTPPDWLTTIASYNWSGVYTSSIDGLLNRSFRNEWREVQPIYSDEFQPLDPRNRTKLHITYLYGGVDRELNSQKSPLDEIALYMRQAEATALIMRLPEQISPVGTIAIDGYDISSDWLKPELLLAILMRLEEDQAFIFGAKKETLENSLLINVIRTGKLVVVEQTLAEVLVLANDAGFIKLGKVAESSVHGKFLSLNNQNIPIPTHLLTPLSAHATILDESIFHKNSYISKEKRYSEFRSFLAESGKEPIWPAYEQEYAFIRDYEIELFNKAIKLLTRNAFDADPIILHGQTGSGKTIALGSVAYRVAKQTDNPVIFISRRNQRINHVDIDKFCQWAEEKGFPPALIIWDGMQELDFYYALQRYLIGRGRKFVLIGSSYKLDINEVQKHDHIEAPANLTDKEIPRFKDFLSSFEDSLGESFGKFISIKDHSFLVALYRLLPETRSQVRKGLHLEAGAAEINIRAKSSNLQPEYSVSVLGQALEKAGLLNKGNLLSQESKNVAGELISVEEELVGLVMVPGKFGLQIPIEILLRSVSDKRITNFHKLFDGIDLFRWSEDSYANIFITARHALEAKIITQSRLGGAKSEIDYAIKLLENIKSSSIPENPELQFAAELVRNLGPNGPEKRLYQNYYIDLADTLKRIREEHSVITPRLMLQEASLLRESIISNLVPEQEASCRLNLLERAESLLVNAIEISNPKTQARLISMLNVELASTYGTRAAELLRENKSHTDVMPYFRDAQRAAMRARSMQPEDTHAIDVLAWTTRDLLQYAELDEKTRWEVIGDLFNFLTLYEGTETSLRDKEKIERRKLEFSHLLNDEELKQDSLEKLNKLGSTAGIYINSLQIAGSTPISEEFPDNRLLARYQDAVSYLDENFDLIKHDTKCLYLYLRFWWPLNTGLPFYPPERTPIYLKPDQWKFALNLIQSLIALDSEFVNPQLHYLMAICKWELGYHDDAWECWNELQRISDRVTGRRRVLKTYLSSNEKGPIKYSGTVYHVSSDGTKGQIFVEGLRQKITFFPQDFGLDDVRRDQAISNFHIAFNYIAPTADPIHHYTEKYKKGK